MWEELRTSILRGNHAINRIVIMDDQIKFSVPRFGTGFGTAQYVTCTLFHCFLISILLFVCKMKKQSYHISHDLY